MSPASFASFITDPVIGSPNSVVSGPAPLLSPLNINNLDNLSNPGLSVLTDLFATPGTTLRPSVTPIPASSNNYILWIVGIIIAIIMMFKL